MQKITNILLFIFTISLLLAAIPSTQRKRRKRLRQLSWEKSSIPLPESIEHNFIDLSTTDIELRRKRDGDTPFFWHVPKSAGSTIKDMYTQCLGLTIACEVGGLNGHDQDETLAVVEMNNGLHYVNVDLDNFEGIQRAKQLGLAQSNLANIIVSTHIHEISQMIFTPNNQGQMFALFRHPVDRVVSLFYYLQTATWESTYNPIYATMTLEEYAFSSMCESNIMVRILAQNPTSAITQEDIAISKEILRRKCLVGLVKDMEESIRRFDVFFGFSALAGDGNGDDGNDKDVATSSSIMVEECKNQYIHHGSNQHAHPEFQRSGKVWDKLMSKNWADVLLYEYVEQLFMEQQELVSKNVQ